MPSADDIADRLQLLATHRRTLAHYLSQQAMLGVAYAPPAIAHGIAESCEQIRQLKAALRGWGIAVEDLPGDDPASVSTPDVGRGVVSSSALHQLRAAAGDFIGREREIEQVVAAFRQAAERGAAAVAALRGLGGVGKTELAYLIAQRVISHYPDAHILIELHGSAGPPLAAEQALRQVIRVFEPERQLSDELNELQTLYRSLLAGQRALILADDAGDAAQVRALLPPPGSVLLITSRQRFSLPGMLALDLGALSHADAKRLLLAICPRLGGRSAQLARLCGALPLALRVSAGLLANDATLRVDRYLHVLADERARLAQLRDADDPEVDVAASLALSYDRLDAEAQSALCQLSVFPASFDRAAAAAIVDPPGGEEAWSIDGLLSLLYRCSLLEYESARDRCTLHELVRAFAAERLGDPTACQIRYARHYAAVARHAEDLYVQGGDQLKGGLTLFDQERAHIDAAWTWARTQAVSQPIDELLVRFALATTYTGTLRYLKGSERIPQLEAALQAARRLGARAQQGRLVNNLGLAHAALGNTHLAIDLYEQGLAIAQETGDRRGEAIALGNLGGVYDDLGSPEQAITRYERSLALCQAIGDQRSEAGMLNNLGLVYQSLGATERAIASYNRALSIKQAIGDRRSVANTLSNLALVYADTGALDQAIVYSERALAIVRDLGDRFGEGSALGRLADMYAAHDAQTRAIESYTAAIAIKRAVGDQRGAAQSSWNLALVLEAHGDLERAAALMQECVDFERETGHPDADKDAGRLEEVRQRAQLQAGRSQDLNSEV